ncbi:MAG: tetratricopeptide (TPR) repeat protein, partial [Pirellulaceae bacterium]
HELSLKLTSRAPRYFGGFTRLSVCCFKKGEYENALEAAQTAVELNPVWEWSYIHRGTAYMACGDFDEGFHDFQRAQELCAVEPPITGNAVGLVLSAIHGKYGESKVEKAREFLIRQVAEDPLNELWHLAMADCAKHDGDTETEIASLRSGIELLRTKAGEGQATIQAQLSRRLSQLAARLSAMGRSDEALVEYNKLLERDPSASVRLKVGVLMKSCGDDAGAALQWTQALLEDRAATFVDYRIRIQTPGTYQLYLRAGSHSEGSDSFYVRIVELGDGPGGKIADWFRHYVKPDNTAADFAANDWSGLSEAERTSYVASHTPGTRMVWNLSTPGDYTVRFIMRESGTALDTFVFQLSNRPPPTEPGPLKSTMTKEKVFLELGGLVVVEAEQYFLRNTGSSGHEWRVLPEEASEIATYKNKRGGAYLQSLPDSGVWTRHALSQTAVLEADALKWDLERYNHWTKAEPDDENWYIARAQTYAGLNEIDKALADLSKIIERNPKNELAWESRARIFANRGQWKNASTDFSRAHELKKAINYYSRYQYALLALGANDTSAYSTACQKLLQQVVQSESPSELHFAGWACALAPEAVNDYSLVLQLAQKAIDADVGNQQYINGLAALQFRAGQFAEALESFAAANNSEESSKTSNAYTVYFRAMTEWQLNRQEDARKTLAQANELAHLELSDADDPPVWNRRLTLELLGKEAADLIGEDADGGE